MRTMLLAVLLVLTVVAAAAAHVTILPRESAAGAAERYTMRVPTEGKVATTVVELEGPAGLTVTEVAAQEGSTHELKREDGRIVGIAWKTNIPPGQRREFVFLARNPTGVEVVVWKVRQRYADGTSSDWFGPAGDPRPASVTKLTAPSP